MSDHDVRAAERLIEEWEEFEEIAAGYIEWLRLADGGMVSRAEYRPEVHGPLWLASTPHDGPQQ